MTTITDGMITDTYENGWYNQTSNMSCFVHPRCQLFYSWETQKVVEATEKKLQDLGFMP